MEKPLSVNGDRRSALRSWRDLRPDFDVDYSTDSKSQGGPERE